MTAFMEPMDSNNQRAAGGGQRAGEGPLAARCPPPAINAPDRTLMRRLAISFAAVFVLVGAFHRLDLLYSHKFFDVTGRAQWIWPRHQISRNIPVAFFATRNFDLPPNRQFARIKVAADPEYTLYFNGVQVGGRRVGEETTLDVYDVSKLARDRGNRMVIAARSADGVGGLIASIDVTDDYKNMVPTGSEWNIVRRWHDDLVWRDPPPVSMSSPMLIGRPPAGRWNYPSRRPGTFIAPPQRIVVPRGAFSFKTAMPRVDVKGGVAVVVSRPSRATAYDFGPTRGRARLAINYDNGVSRVVRVRFANDRSELFDIEGPIDSFVFAAGERTITDPQERQFRYVMVYDSRANVAVVQ